MGNIKWDPPFHEEKHDLSLMYKISQGQREITIHDTPNDYVNLYTGKYYNLIYCLFYLLNVYLIKYIFLIIRMLEW